MIVGSMDGNQNPNRKTYYRSIVRNLGGRIYRYKYYTYNGKEGFDREDITPAFMKAENESTNFDRNVNHGVTIFTKPSFVPSGDTKKFTAKKPEYELKDPGPQPVFQFNKEEPTRTEVILPQAVPEPGPMPVFNFEGGEEVARYEYVHGIKNIDIKHKQYEPRSVFVSTPMQVDGNVMQVSLNAVEEHPVFDGLDGKAADRQTSIEYYITYAENPVPSEWYPILPEDVKVVKCELLMFSTSKTAKLRFPAQISGTQRATVYKDQVALDRKLWTFAEGGTRVQLLIDQDPKAIYTIDYTPNVDAYNPWTIDINQKESRRQKKVDRFPEGANHNKTIVLSEYPYIDYEKINTTTGYDPNLNEYKPIIVRLKNAGIAGPNRTTYKEALPFTGAADQKVFTKNITDYKTGAWKKPRPYSLKDDDAYNGFEFWQENNKLYFSETFNKADIHTNYELSHGNAEIEVEYEYLVSNFRIKIISRRNTADVNTLTPIVHEYALKYRIMK